MKHLVSYRGNGNNVQWQLWKSETGYDHDQVILAVLMDIREELQKLNILLHCPNFRDIPHVLRSIDKRIAKKRRSKIRM